MPACVCCVRSSGARCLNNNNNGAEPCVGIARVIIIKVSPTTGKEQFFLNTYALLFLEAAIVFSSLFQKIAPCAVIIIHRIVVSCTAKGVVFTRRVRKIGSFEWQKRSARIPLGRKHGDNCQLKVKCVWTRCWNALRAGHGRRIMFARRARPLGLDFIDIIEQGKC